MSEDFEENAHPTIEEVVAKYAGVKLNLPTSSKHPSTAKHFCRQKILKGEYIVGRVRVCQKNAANCIANNW